jgi:hypothetical protein
VQVVFFVKLFGWLQLEGGLEADDGFSNTDSGGFVFCLILGGGYGTERQGCTQQKGFMGVHEVICFKMIVLGYNTDFSV